MSLCLSFVLCLSLGGAAAFVVPQPFLAPAVVPLLAPIMMIELPQHHSSSARLFDQHSAAITAFHQQISSSAFLMSDEGSLISQAGGILRNILVAVTAVAFLLAGITFIYASYIIPEAAKQLEKETKELAPELWTEYQAKLGEGEVLAMRPELMQELGAKMQPYIERKIMAQQQQQQQGKASPSPSSKTMSTGPSDVIEAEVVVDKDAKPKQDDDSK